MKNKIAQELKRTKVCLDIAEELSFLVWATLGIKGEDLDRLQSELDSAVNRLKGRFAALDELDRQVNPYNLDNYIHMLESKQRYSELADKLGRQSA